MAKGWQIFIWDETDEEYYYHDSFKDVIQLANACHELGLMRQRIEVREVN